MCNRTQSTSIIDKFSPLAAHWSKCSKHIQDSPYQCCLIPSIYTPRPISEIGWAMFKTSLLDEYRGFYLPNITKQSIPVDPPVYDRGKLNSSLFHHKSDFTDDDISTTNPTASRVLPTNLGLKSSQTRSYQIPYPSISHISMISPSYHHEYIPMVIPYHSISFHIPYPHHQMDGIIDPSISLHGTVGRSGRRRSRPHGLL